MTKNTWIGIGVIVVVVVAGFLVLGHHGSATQSQSQVAQAGQNQINQTQTGSASSTPAGTGSYLSSADGFVVDFPETPEVTKTTFDSPTAGSIPRTEYTAESGSGSSAGYYGINVYHYPQGYTFASDYLTGALQLYVTGVDVKYPGTKLVSQTSTEFSGNPAISGVLTVPIDGTQTNGYVLIVTKGQNTYGMGTYGVDQSGYDAFVNSFAFTQ